jgi:class 3 adenylate cyclase
MATVRKSLILDKYRKREDIREKLPNYQVKLGFGLHVGWAIEGAIGSEFKIDASYLSPNVNLASRLESATKQFGVYILVSH